MRLLILTPGELTVDPRARRAAAAAVRRGLQVDGACPLQPGRTPVPLEGVRVERAGGASVDSGLRRVGLTAPGDGRREGPLLREARGLYRLARLAATTVALVRAARRLDRPDAVHANDLDTLPAAALIARRARARLIYDAHELYASFEADPPRLYRAAMLALERVLARRADSVVTVSDPIAGELVRTLGLARRPTPVLNCPLRSAAPDVAPEPAAAPGPAPAGRALLAIYQGSLGHGRYLSDLLDALAVAPGVELTLLVPGIDRDGALAEAAARGLVGRLHVPEAVAPDALVAALAAHDIGLVIDRPGTRNVALALPNKLFDYLMAGLAVAVPDLPGMAPLVREEAVGVTYVAGSAAGLGEALAALAADPTELAAMRRRAREAAVSRYCWEAQEEALVHAWGVAP